MIIMTRMMISSDNLINMIMMILIIVAIIDNRYNYIKQMINT